ncbi:MAG: hypothetical protein HY874_00500 [Chloroflexi bacterium]|nr:hypothetical protein [Chloroflexota bacterium]
MKLMGAGFYTEATLEPHLKLGEPVLAMRFPAGPKEILRLPQFSVVLILCDGKPGPFTLVGRMNGPASSSQAIKETYDWPQEAWHFTIIRHVNIVLQFEGPGYYSLAFLIDAEPLVELTLPLRFEGD